MKTFFNYTIPLIAAAVLGIACQKKVAAWRTIAVRATSPQVTADGSQLDTIYADLPINALQADLGVIFQTSTGLFSNGADTMTVIANRTDIDKGKITAMAVWRASLIAGTDTITASTNTTPQVVNTLMLDMAPSAAVSIQLAASAFSVPVDFGGEITITGTLYNKAGGMVSIGTPVRFTDTYQSNGTAVGGEYRQLQNLSDSFSQVSTIYTPGAAATPGTFMYVNATILDQHGNPTGTPGSVLIYITPQ